METTRPEITGRQPLAVTFCAASEISGLGPTTLWKFAKEGRIRLIRPPGIRRTLIDYASLKSLLLQDKADAQSDTPASRHHQRPRKIQTRVATP
jgi:hypothetical protein